MADQDNSTGAQLTSRLLSLPPELRNTIYEYVLDVPRGGKRRTLLKRRSNIGDSASRRKSPKRSVLTLLQTCRQIYNEARCMFYWINTLHTNRKNMRCFHAIGAARCRGVQIIRVHCRELEDATGALRKAIYLPGLVSIRMYIYTCASPESITREIPMMKKALAKLKMLNKISLVQGRKVVRSTDARDIASVKALPDVEKQLQQYFDQRREKRLCEVGTK